MDDRKSLSITFLTVSNQYATFFCHKMVVGGRPDQSTIFDYRKPQNGCRRPFWMTENHFRSHFSTFQIIHNFFFFWIFFTKWLPAAILDDQKSRLITFLAISDQYTTFFVTKWLPAVARISQPFLITENHKMAAGGHFG